MGMLVDGQWHDVWYDTKATKGRFVRSEAQFRNWVTPDGSPGPTGKGGFRAEPDRYHLYVSFACPWAHRTLIFRKLKGLEPLIPISAVNTYMGKDGWTFDSGARRDSGLRQWRRSVSTSSTRSPIRATRAARRSRFSGTSTSARSCRTNRRTSSGCSTARSTASARTTTRLLSATAAQGDRRDQRAGLSERQQRRLSHGVRDDARSVRGRVRRPCSPRSTELEARLATRRYLTGERITEADWRLFTTLVRFDAVYYGHFKCNKRRLIGLPEPMGLRSRPLSNTGRRRHRAHRLHQDALLREPREHQSDRHHSGRAGHRFHVAARPQLATRT